MLATDCAGLLGLDLRLSNLHRTGILDYAERRRRPNSEIARFVNSLQRGAARLERCFAKLSTGK